MIALCHGWILYNLHSNNDAWKSSNNTEIRNLINPTRGYLWETLAAIVSPRIIPPGLPACLSTAPGSSSNPIEVSAFASWSKLEESKKESGV
jgi:hypothetical protein